MTGQFSDDDLSPPSSDRVAKRALVMSAVIHRAFMEPRSEEPEVQTECQNIITWLKHLNIQDELEVEEREILNTPPGKLSDRQVINSTWRSEGLAVLAWALNCFDLPAYDEMVDPQAVVNRLYFLDEGAEELLISPNLRASNELEQYAERMFALHWRLQEFRLNPKKMNFRQFAEEAWFGPLDVSGLRFINNDLAIGHSELSIATSQDIQKCVSITIERHQAANWLIGYDEIYSEVDTST